MLKIRISDLDSAFREFCANLSKTSEKGGRPQEHVHFLTRQGAGWNFAKFGKVTQAVGNKRVMSINPHLVGDNGRGHGRDILIIIKSGLHHWTGEVAFCKVAVAMMTRSPIRTMFVVIAVLHSSPMMPRRIYTLYMTLVTGRDAEDTHK